MSDTDKAVVDSDASVETPSIAELKEKAAKDVTAVSNGNSGNSNNGDEVSNGEKHSDEDSKDSKTENGVNSSAEDEEEEEAMEVEEGDKETEEEEKESEDDAKVANGEKTPVKNKDGDEEDGSSPVRRSSRKKSTPAKYQDELDVDEVIESEEEEINDVEEVKDDDSDVMEVDAEDPLSGNDPLNNEKKKSTPNIVTIDDVKTLHRLANTAKQKAAEKEEKVVFIDTNSILAGRATSGVTITPARPKNAPPAVPAQGFASGVTISQTNKAKAAGAAPGSSLLTEAVTAAAAASSKSSNTAFGYDAKGQLNDPNLTDDTFVVEAPSFIVPYVYEKPPVETIKDFRDSIKELIEKKKKEDEEKKKQEEEDKKKKEEEEKAKKKKGGRRSTRGRKEESESEEEEYSSDSSAPKEDDKDEDFEVPIKEKKKESDDEIMEIKEEEAKENEKPKNFFESSLGRFFFDLGMNFVQESVQADLLATQIKRSQKDKSASVMHAIMSLKKNLEDSKETNEPFAMELKKCRFCSFKTESKLVMEHHLETPHMKMFMYRCNFCDFETKMPQEVLGHMYSEHGIRGRLERAPAMHQCPQCPFEDNMKGKLTRHKTGCDKRFRHETNQQPPHDWEPPAKIPKPPVPFRGGAGGARPIGSSLPVPGQQFRGASQFGSLHMNKQSKMASIYSGMPQLQMGPRGRGRPVGSYKPGSSIPLTQQQIRSGLFSQGGRNNQGLFMNNQVVLQAINPSSRGGSSLLLPTSLGPSGSVTIQSINNRGGAARGNTQPSISITPLPGGRSAGNSRGSSPQAALKPGQPGQNKASFVICEICDGYIKDLEQLRNHMQWIHKVKIHPKMIYNRPPLNCQKCRFRFFTDQGLERHLLGSHGLVTASMQDLANKGQDSGRCPVCGKVYQWKLLNHVAKDHQKTLKPAHLSYKCTVCTATFGQYKLFENHVYTAHSGASKKADKAKQQASSAKSTSLLKTTKLSDEITIIPQSKTLPKSATTDEASTSDKKPESGDDESEKKESGDDEEEKDPDVIELDDEEEIDDVEDDEDTNAEVINLDSSIRSSAQSSKQTSASTSKHNSEDENSKQSQSQDEEEELEDEDEENGPPAAKRSKPETEEEEEEGVEEIEDEEEEG